MSLADRLRAIVDPLPAGAAVTLPANIIRAWLDEEPAPPHLELVEPESLPLPWRIHFWSAPAETRIGRTELLEAVGRPASWLYRATSATKTVRQGDGTVQVRKDPRERIPHRKLDGELVFVVGEVREWLREREEIVEARPPRRVGPRSA